MAGIEFIPVTHSCGDSTDMPSCEELQNTLAEAQQQLAELSELIDQIRQLISEECPEPREPVPPALIGQIIRLERRYTQQLAAFRRIPF